MRHAHRSLAVLSLGLVMLAGCGSGSVSAADVEQEAATQFGEQFPVDSVECDEDLPAEVGASITCVLVSEGASFEMTATASGIEDGQVSLDLELTDEL